jgi:hypothetical protein
MCQWFKTDMGCADMGCFYYLSEWTALIIMKIGLRLFHPKMPSHVSSFPARKQPNDENAISPTVLITLFFAVQQGPSLTVKNKSTNINNNNNTIRRIVEK